jgi:hypothetical protein
MLKGNQPSLFTRLIFRLLEMLDLIWLSGFLIFSTFIVYTTYCDTSYCQRLTFEENQFFLYLSSLIISWGVINSLRVASFYYVTDPDRKPEVFFYASLICLGIAFVIFGIDPSGFEEVIGRRSANTPNFLGYVLFLGIAIFSFFSEAGIWSKLVPYLKLRVGLSYLLAIICLINPTFGLLAALPLIPTIILSLFFIKDPQ